MGNGMAANMPDLRYELAGCGLWKLLMVLLLSSPNFIRASELEDCSRPMGMQSKEIPDEDISASSKHDMSVGPQYARLHNNSAGGAWCPKNMVTPEAKEYLEINLRSVRFLTSTMTQGRSGSDRRGVEFTENYYIEYWRPGFTERRRWRNRQGIELLTGNDNPQTESRQIFDPPIIASKIRFVPYVAHVRTICMRVELYGCTWTEGVVSYSMPQGVVRGLEVNLTDESYDGFQKNGYLSNGLGQLTDHRKGLDNYRIDNGYEWIGWRNDVPSMMEKPVEIIFEFDYLRNFSAMHLHTNNYFSKEVQVFKKVNVYLSAEDNQFSGEPVVFSYMPDSVLEQARDVTIKLHSRAGRFIKLQMFFAAKWIMLSEIQFDSVIAEPKNITKENVTVNNTTTSDTLISTTPAAATAAFTPPISATGSPFPSNNEGPLQRDEVKATFNKVEINDSIFSDKNKETEPKQLVGLIIGILTTLIIMLIAAIAFIFYRSRRLKATLTPTTFFDQHHGGLKVSVEDHANKGPICPPLPLQYDPCAYTGLIATTINTSKPEVKTAAITTPHLHKATTVEIADKSHIDTLIFSKINLTQVIDSADEYTPPIPPPPEKYYSSSDVRKSPPLPPLPPSPDPSSPALTSRKASSSFNSFSPEDMLTEEDEEDFVIFDFPREKLNIVESLGFGYFGDIHICAVDNFSEREDIFRNTSSSLVIVKSLKPNSSDAKRLEFQGEAKKLSKLKNFNVTRVIGASLKNDPMCIVIENTDLGDLNQYLQGHLAETSSVQNAKTLSFGTLIYMATQIASGMKYLEEMDFIHKDLATRNCLVTQGYRIKVSDLGPGRNLYSADYYKVEGRPPLPIRWMAWESILMGTYTIKTDIWSFAVTLWEILTFAREQPFEELPDHRIITNATYFYQGNESRIILPMPKNCLKSKDIYELMCECWQQNDIDRPTFRDVHLFLQRKNLGYKPNLNDT